MGLVLRGTRAIQLHEELGAELKIQKSAANGDAVTATLEEAKEQVFKTQHRGGNVLAVLGVDEAHALLDRLGRHQEAYSEQEAELDDAKAEIARDRAAFVRDTAARLLASATFYTGHEDTALPSPEALKVCVDWARALDNALHAEEG
jgi:hypothetical protein